MTAKELPPLGEEEQRVLDAIYKSLGAGFVAGGFGDVRPTGLLKAAPEVTETQVASSLPELIRAGMVRLVIDGSETIRPELTEQGRRAANAAVEIAEWLSSPLKPQRTHGTRLHDFRAAIDSGTTIDMGDGQPAALRQWPWERIGVFVVEHDWAAAFEGADLGEIEDRKAPYPQSCFELTISGKRICAVLDEDDGGYVVAIATRGGWFLLNRELEFFDYLGVDYSGLLPAITAQVDAILVALDSGVAATAVIRASAPLNKARAKKGKLPVFDYHAVTLARRARALPLPEASAPGERGSPRLHFRRGHWRHLSHHKVWINWTLVGDPDLGFIDKHYRL